MHRGIIILWRGSSDSFILDSYFYLFIYLFFVRLHRGCVRHCECTQSSLLPKTFSNRHTPTTLQRYRVQQATRSKCDAEELREFFLIVCYEGLFLSFFLSFFLSVSIYPLIYFILTLVKTSESTVSN